MKALRILFLGLLVTVWVAKAQTTDPGWFSTGIRPLPVESRSSFSVQQFHANGLLSTTGVPSVPVAEVITPQIQALADGLQDDPVQIFDYVHDHIKFVLYYGSKKGANLTLLEKSGNDFDQSALLVALLRAAGYTNVLYQFGWQQIPYDNSASNNYDLHHWWQLTLNNTNWTSTVNYLFYLVGTRGYPRAYYADDGNPAHYFFYIQRVWVLLTIGSTSYQLDPAFKISLPVSPAFSLTNAMGSGTVSNELISAAGGTDNVNYAASLSESAVRGKLTSYTTNLLSYIQSNAPNASMQDVLGGWRIVPAYNPVDFSTATTFTKDEFNGQMPTLSWANEPTNLMSTFSINFAGTNYQCYMPQLQGQRLALTFDGSGMAQFWQDDVNLAQHATSGGGTTSVVLSVTHPDGTWDVTNNVFIYNSTNLANHTVTNSYQCTNATYALTYAFEPDWGWLQQRQKKLDSYYQQGYTNGSRQVTSETLNIMGLSWMLQTAQAGQMICPQLGIIPMYYHRIGRMGQEAGHGYYVDVYMQRTGQFPSGGFDTPQIQSLNTALDLWSLFASALEHGLIEQLQSTNLVGASTVKMLEIANTNGQAVYLANSGNWSSIQGNLINYGDTLTQIYNQLISQGYYVLLPANGSNHVSATTGSWAGYGYEARLAVNGLTAVSLMTIAGGYHGGFSALPVLVDYNYVQITGDSQPGTLSQVPEWTQIYSIGDPVDAANGTFQVEHTDLSLGQAEPRGITLSRYYNGTIRNGNSAGMAGGWIHNYMVAANNVPAAQAGLGGSIPAQAASLLTATAAAIATYNVNVPNAKNWLTTALIVKWGVDQLTKNGVSVNLGKDSLLFVQQPNGSFTPPANCTMTMALANSAYHLSQRHGNTFNFDSFGRLTNIVDQYNNPLTVTYTNGNLPFQVADWKGRKFMFNYTGGQLTSVSDGTRTVNYGYSTDFNPQGDLTSFTDAEGKTTSYSYDTNHQITATVDALSQMVVSNIYDSQGHITRQYTQGATNKIWRVYWTGWSTTEFDPANGRQQYFFDDQSRLIAQVDALGNTNRTFYDGLNHVVATVSPLLETNRFIYDGNNNLTYSIDALGQTNRFVYDGQNNLIRSVDPVGNPTTFGYNTQFSLIGKTNGAGDWMTYGFNTDGNLGSSMNAGGSTAYTYDATYRQLTSITYPGGLGVEYFTNNAVGNLIGHQDARGFSTSYQYNNRREVTNTIAPSNVVMSVSFDAVGNVASATDARNNTTFNTWSPTRHLLSTTFPATPQGTPVITNGYDQNDNLVRSVDPLQKATLYTNDLNARLVSVTDPVLRTTTFTYDKDGRKLATVNAASETNSQTWDARGALLKLTDGAGHFSTRAYDAAGNQIILTNRNGKKWQFQFDGANRLTNTITPMGRSTSVAFNHQGLAASIKDQASQSSSLSYDAKGRLTSRVDNVGSTVYGFDASDNPTSIVESGKTNAWTYDAYNRATTYQDTSGSLIQYRYDASGNLTNLIYPGGKNVFYAYDNLNRMTNVTDWSGRKTSIGYDLNSHVTGITRPNGSHRTIAYDAAGQVTNILEQMANGLPIAILTHGWTNTGSMAWEFAAPLPHMVTVPTRSMTYDDDNRLLKVNDSYVTNDLDGNLTYSPLTNSTFVTQMFDARNRLTSSGGVTNFCDAANNRIAQSYGTNTTTFVVNPNAKLPQVLLRVKLGVTNYYIYGAGLLYQITETAAKTNTLTYHFDYRGSTIALSA
ncbi:MAG: transglutaminase domain-containing protein, partial [Verrucomicrobiota bacterium]